MWTHVHMVCEAMASLPAWRELPETERYILFTAALLHDVAKPICTRVEPDGSISSRGHSWRGAVRARQILWKRGIPFILREQITGLIRHHLVPFFVSQSEAPERIVIEVSQSARCDWLSLLAESDARGRICPDPDNLLKQIADFREIAKRLGCYSSHYAFNGDAERFNFFQVENMENPPKKSEGLEIIMMSGLPGAGKDFWIQKHFPDMKMISVDALRHQNGQSINDTHSAILAKAREIAREELEAHHSFIFNGTNLTRHARKDCIRLFAQYGVRVRLVYVETSFQRLLNQNRSRKKRVPDQVIERLLDRWEVPDRTEGHEVEWVIH